MKLDILKFLNGGGLFFEMQYCLLVGINGTVSRLTKKNDEMLTSVVFSYEPFDGLMHRVVVQMEYTRILPNPEIGTQISFIGKPSGFTSDECHLQIKPDWHNSIFSYVPDLFYKQLTPTDEIIYPSSHLRILVSGVFKKLGKSVVKNKQSFLTGILAVELEIQGKKIHWELAILCLEENTTQSTLLKNTPLNTVLFVDGSIGVEKLRNGQTETSQIIVFVNEFFLIPQKTTSESPLLLPLTEHPTTAPSLMESATTSSNPETKKPLNSKEFPGILIPDGKQIVSDEAEWLGMSITDFNRQTKSKPGHSSSATSTNQSTPESADHLMDDEFLGDNFI